MTAADLARSGRVEAPLGQRLGVLQLVRLGAATVVALAAVLLPPGVVGGSSVAASAAAYASATTVAELLRRTRPQRWTWMVWPLLAADGLWLAAVVTQTGGVRSVLSALVPFHVVAVTLLVSHRTGLRVALWHAGLLVVGHGALRSGVVTPDAPVAGGLVPTDSLAAFGALSFLLFAGGAALFSSLNERALLRSRAHLASLVALGRELDRCRGVDAVMLTVARHATRRLGAGRAVVAMTGESGTQAVVSAARGTKTFYASSAAPVGVPGEVILRRHLDAATDGLLDSLLPDAANVVFAPLVADNERLGVVAVEWGGGRRTRIHAQTVSAIEQAASQAALALRTAILLSEVERLASTDGLTGLLNRRSFDLALAREVARVARTGRPLSLVLVDIDHFKAVNDTLGHPAGDEVLRQAAAGLRTACREVDVVARYGGEEFAVLLPDCGGAQAVRTAERLRTALRTDVTAVPVTASAGVATVPANAADPSQLLAAADEALYRAKRAGRDRTTRAPRPRRSAESTGSTSARRRSPRPAGAAA